MKVLPSATSPTPAANETLDIDLIHAKLRDRHSTPSSSSLEMPQDVVDESPSSSYQAIPRPFVATERAPTASTDPPVPSLGGVTSARDTEQQRAVACVSELLSVFGLSTSVQGSEDLFFPQKVGTESSSSSSPGLPVSAPLLSEDKSGRSDEERSRRAMTEPSVVPASVTVAAPRRRIFQARYEPPAPCCSPEIPRRLSQSHRNRSAPGLTTRPGKSLLKRNDGSSSRSLKRTGSSVSFSKLEIREFNIALSDHPDCSYGPGIQLGWNFSDQEPVSVDRYEETRPTKQRTGSELLVPYPVRKEELQKAGYTKQELQSATEEVARVKRERKLTDYEIRPWKHRQRIAPFMN